MKSFLFSFFIELNYERKIFLASCDSIYHLDMVEFFSPSLRGSIFSLRPGGEASQVESS